MSYIVAEVHSWHPPKPAKKLKRRAKVAILHSKHTTAEEARTVRASLNSGHKRQRYWALDSTGRII